MIQLQCTAHPRYKGNKSPKPNCKACDSIYRIYNTDPMYLDLVASRKMVIK